MSFGKVKPKIGGRDYLRLEEVIEQCELPGDEWVTVRFLPADIVSMKNHWIKIRTKSNKEVNLPRLCLSHSLDGSNTPRLDENGEAIECPYCSLQHGNRESGAPANANVSYYANAIVREIQEDEPRKKAKLSRSEEKTGFKEVKSKSWTPVRMVRLTNTMVARIQEIGENNRVKKKGKTVAYDVTDAKYGIDLRIKYKPKASGSDKYTIDADGSERTPLTEDELSYLTFNIDETVMGLIGLRSVAEAEEDFKTLNVVGGDVPLDDDDDEGYSLGGDEDDEDEAPKRKKRRAAFDDDEDDGDDEDEKPRRKKKRSSTFDDDEDEAPKRKKKRSSTFDDGDEEDEAPKRKKKRKVVDDEDEPVRKKKRSSTFDDGDDEDEPVRKKKRKVVDDEDEPVRKKKKRKVVDDEDEAPKRKKKRRPAFD